MWKEKILKAKLEISVKSTEISNREEDDREISSSCGLWAKFVADDRNLVSVQIKDSKTGNKDCHRQSEQESTIIFYFDAEKSQVTQNRAAHRPERQQRANRRGARNEQKNGGSQLDNARADASPRLDAQHAENVF